MIYLGLRTDTPQAHLVLFHDRKQVGEYTWEAGRALAKELLTQIEKFLATHEYRFDDIGGLFVYQGPGSFTGLRIGMTVLNTMAYAQKIPIVAMQGDDWVSRSIERLQAGDNDTLALPHYGAEARITTPKK